ncbi:MULTISPECIES: antitoxin [unclassified Microcella]|uniref:antitoxin n=1 Tax=unclassified Microcella TaxID=2630066 RepID=UPI0006FB9D46|nr:MULTISPECIES: antitoxin [unclassified Microcella]KQV25133.1 antitoxin protein [Yonghaparkia sp. Root332]KRF31415.1 antitoxin protein [Yonghaparkia sp. Soil809]
MGIDDITNKAKEFLESDEVKGMLESEQAEDISDKVLDGVADVADKVTGGKFTDQIADVKSNIDGAIGTDRA